ncbi:MAG: RNA 2'-phosphotransferase [Phycisphaerales bacterium]
MNASETVRVSKRLSYVLRHQPDSVGLVLDDAGWVDVSALLDALSAHGPEVSAEMLRHVVVTNSKQRFEFDANETRIRARQGHSVEVRLGYEPISPPAVLYHGTPDQSLASVLATGLDKRARHHVHLSADQATTIEAARRRGKPVLLAIDAAAMDADGHVFFRAENGVWLTDHVPVRYLGVVEAESGGG